MAGREPRLDRGDEVLPVSEDLLGAPLPSPETPLAINGSPVAGVGALPAASDSGLRRLLRPSTFDAFRSREYRLLWIGLVISVIGQQVQVLGTGLLIIDLAIRDGMPQLAGLYVGLVGVSRALPGLGFGLYAGVLSDRMDRRQLLMIAKLVGSLA